MGPDVMLCWMGVPLVEVLRTATQLRAAGLTVEVFPEPAKLGQQLQYADADGVKARFALILGDRELAEGNIGVKHLASGRQHTLPIAQVDRARLDQISSATSE
jgi:histidyl-tRNA synthetase